MEFLNEKKNALSKIDKSSKGIVDQGIRELLKYINRLNDFYTTSSCSGRFIVVKEASKKIKNAILLSYHDPPSLDRLLRDLKKILKVNKSMLLFKYEPAILHVIASNIENAAKFVELARQLGFKKSGFYFGSRRKRPVIELVSTETLALPIAYHAKLVVSENYLSMLLNFAKKLHNKNKLKIKKLLKGLQKWKS